MRVNLIAFVVLLLTVSISACGSPEAQPEPAAEAGPSEADDRAALEQLTDQWYTAFNAADAEGVASLYTDDAVVMNPNVPTWVGREAIQTGWQADFDGATFEVASEIDEIRVHGDWALVRGRDTSTRTPTDGDPIQETSKWLAIHERQPDGSWKITHDIWNSNDPAQ